MEPVAASCFGLAFAPGPLMVSLISPLGGRLARTIGAGSTFALGCTTFAASGVVRVVFFGLRPDNTALLPVALLTGVGVGLALPTLFSVGTTALPSKRFATGTQRLGHAVEDAE